MTTIEQRRMSWDEIRRVILDAQAEQRQVTITNLIDERFTGSAFLERATRTLQLYGRHRDSPFEGCIHFAPEEVAAAEATELPLVVPYYMRVDDEGCLSRSTDLLSASTRIPPGTTVIIAPLGPS